MISGIVIINGTSYHEDNKIFNLYFKQKKNQVGIFSFDAYSLDETDLENIKERQIVVIMVFGTIRMYGYIEKVTKDKFTHTWHVEGKSLAGILDTKVTDVPVVIRLSPDGDLPYTKELVHEAMFRFGGFKKTGDTGWRIVGGDGVPVNFYKFEARTVLDHISNIAKISGYDWECYLA